MGFSRASAYKSRRGFHWKEDLASEAGGGKVSTWHDETMRFSFDGESARARYVITHVYRALQEKGYDPVSQIVGYLMSGDPTYITSHNGARSLMREIDRDILIEAMLVAYLDWANDETTHGQEKGMNL